MYKHKLDLLLAIISFLKKKPNNIIEYEKKNKV